MGIEAATRKRRCSTCGQWTIGNVYYCGHCSAVMDPRRDQDRLKLIGELQKKRADIAAEASKPPFTRAMLRIGRVFETIYLAFISFIAWLLFWLGG